MARVALQRASTGDDVAGTARRAGQRTVFTVKAGLRPHARASYEEQGEAMRRRKLQLDAWRADCAAWEITHAICDPVAARF